jgi:hypothetical protein
VFEEFRAECFQLAPPPQLVWDDEAAETAET